MRFLEQLSASWTRLRQRRRLAGARIRCTPDALVFEPSDGQPETVAWREITSVSAFKRDCYTVDSIRLLIVASGGRAFELAEHDEGFEEAAGELPRYLEGCLPFEGWYFTVAFPAFETNLTHLWPPRETVALNG